MKLTDLQTKKIFDGNTMSLTQALETVKTIEEELYLDNVVFYQLLEKNYLMKDVAFKKGCLVLYSNDNKPIHVYTRPDVDELVDIKIYSVTTEDYEFYKTSNENDIRSFIDICNEKLTKGFLYDTDFQLVYKSVSETYLNDELWISVTDYKNDIYYFTYDDLKDRLIELNYGEIL